MNERRRGMLIIAFVITIIAIITYINTPFLSPQKDIFIGCQGPSSSGVIGSKNCFGDSLAKLKYL